jgi:cytoskeletal protein RodZ
MSIGAALADARRQAGLTVTEVSHRTRIRETIIQGIEQDDYSACGGDVYARGHIRSIAHAVGADPGPLIREYDATEQDPHTITAADVFEPATPIRMRERRRVHWSVVLMLAILAALGVLAYYFVSGSSHPPSAARAPGAASTTHRQTVQTKPHPAPATTHATTVPARPAAPARTLRPVSATAFGPGGASQGDDPQSASLAIDGSPAAAWHTDWYTTARFGNLQLGTGLLLDMGKPVTITGAQLTLGSSPGADVQLRVGAAPVLADLAPVAGATDVHGAVRLRLSSPARARFVLIWFTRLPPDSTGTFQASVYDVRLEGP